ncbi:hypothetical protein THAOC_14084 [Thalassiosira oceanica]|uniref:Uncharacterized protein n=1 Tax=Thalassiosira oceanica TaxID=159749 RepID=K0SJI6_THAOC|nr:hypothetical protein THAOC_14084 [Thalassiosira oceanica]|eukprot:EJK65104.1 hypothetical protein THAOC_14084 [Thalassiosira oceanica]
MPDADLIMMTEVLVRVPGERATEISPFRPPLFRRRKQPENVSASVRPRRRRDVPSFAAEENDAPARERQGKVKALRDELHAADGRAYARDEGRGRDGRRATRTGAEISRTTPPPFGRFSPPRTPSINRDLQSSRGSREATLCPIPTAALTGASKWGGKWSTDG